MAVTAEAAVHGAEEVGLAGAEAGADGRAQEEEGEDLVQVASA